MRQAFQQKKTITPSPTNAMSSQLKNTAVEQTDDTSTDEPKPSSALKDTFAHRQAHESRSSQDCSRASPLSLQPLHSGRLGGPPSEVKATDCKDYSIAAVTARVATNVVNNLTAG